MILCKTNEISVLMHVLYPPEITENYSVPIRIIVDDASVFPEISGCQQAFVSSKINGLSNGSGHRK